MATETEDTAESFASEHTDIITQRRYLRLNVTKGLETVGLEDASKRNIIATMTERYGNLNDTQMKLYAFRECVNTAPSRSTTLD